jgi:hypothetical protein
MPRSALLALSVCLAALPSCKNGEQPAPREKPGAQPATSGAAASASVAASASASAPAARAQNVSGKIPFDYPMVTTTARPGDYVLAPPRAWLDEALENGADKQPFIYYGAWLTAAGKSGSIVRTLPGPEEEVPNSLLIPIPKGESARPGDIVLTTWASGTGMQRAIVVEGEKPTSPQVRYLDLALDHPTGWGEKVDTLPPNTFHRLTRPGEVGTTVACREGKRYIQRIVTHRSGDKLLGLGFAGQLKVVPAADCREVPLVPKVKLADRVFVPVLGTFTEAKVKQVDAEAGRVFVSYQVGDEKQKTSVGFTNVAVDLPVPPNPR